MKYDAKYPGQKNKVDANAGGRKGQGRNWTPVLIGAVLGLLLVILGMANCWFGHTWNAATCTSPKTCAACGKTEGSAAGHNYLAATATSPKMCSVCGHTVGTVASQSQPQTHTHSWMDATCESPRTCRSCGEVSGKALGHQWMEATYQNPKTCSVCGKTEGAKQQAAPVYINTMDYYSKSGKIWMRSENAVGYTTHSDAKDLSVWSQENIPGHTVGKVYDVHGNGYTYGLHLDGSETRTYYISYDLDGAYTRFTGWCAFPDNPLSQNAWYSEKYFEIYADGKLIYTTGLMDCDTAPEWIDVDVTGVDILTIQYPATKNNNEAATLYDGRLS